MEDMSDAKDEPEAQVNDWRFSGLQTTNLAALREVDVSVPFRLPVIFEAHWKVYTMKFYRFCWQSNVMRALASPCPHISQASVLEEPSPTRLQFPRPMRHLPSDLLLGTEHHRVPPPTEALALRRLTLYCLQGRRTHAAPLGPRPHNPPGVIGRTRSMWCACIAERP